jgi:hypothetical protein
VRPFLIILLALASGDTWLAAQTERVEAEPIACWWRTSAGAVRIGEPFEAVVTCSLLETEGVRAIVDDSRLDPAILQLPPFEVIGGRRAKDVITAGRRFSQYEYRLQIIAENAFGRDVSLPALQLNYRVENRVPSAASGVLEAIQGREFTYALPSISIRVLSLVPNDATDIRETPVASFDRIADRAFRGTVLRVSAVIAFVVAALVAGVALLGLARRRQARAAIPGRILSDSAILDSVGRELAAVQQESRESGWNPSLAGRALTALRIAAAYASGRPVSQQAGGTNGTAPGQLAVNGRRKGTAFVSGTVTAEGVGSGSHEALRDGLARFTAARYGRDGRLDGSKLDEALGEGITIVEQLAAERKPSLRERLWMR